MAKRTRLPKNPPAGRRDRLASAIRFEVAQMSAAQLKDFATAKKSVLELDPLVRNYYKPLALREISRRKELAKTWGSESPILPSKGVLAVAEVFEQPAKYGRKYYDFVYGAATGKFATDIVAATDYLVDKLGELHKRGAKAKERWSGFAKAHDITGMKERDYLRKGFEVKQRFGHDVNPNVLEQAHRSYRAGYKDVVIVPAKVDGEMVYSVLVRGVK